jgi:hypothetical protein
MNSRLFECVEVFYGEQAAKQARATLPGTPTSAQVRGFLAALQKPDIQPQGVDHGFGSSGSLAFLDAEQMAEIGICPEPEEIRPLRAG